ncbi:hypothetical protein [Candidatus Thiodictyon syntrophicum]|nr:hypothetical protein [Candidatus Thiodictyon syntrophicum]
MKYSIISGAGAIAIALSGVLCAQLVVDQVPSDSADQYKQLKVDEATAADARYHANRTEPNRQARDQAEAQAGAAIERANGPAPQQSPR